ncbi:MAG TPA: NUDIX domain-containing protein [Candidatus Saccharimonadales bacterium]|nr:NUDIX domain-containing protein [Candidatus Saccharimonadales bacterium]
MSDKKFTCVDIHGNSHEIPEKDLRWLPGIYAVVIQKGKVLLTNQHGRYVLPGGSEEFGEMPEETAIRETFEETGIRVANPRLLNCKSNLFVMPGINKPVQSLQIFYACDFVGGELSSEGFDEHEKSWSGPPEWVPLNKLDSLKLGSSFEWRDVVRTVAKFNQ